MPRRFSKRHKTFKDWQKGRKSSKYTNKIIQAHALNPKGVLRQLRKAKLGNQSSKKWIALLPSHRSKRINALSVLSELRKGKSILSTVKQFGFSLLDGKNQLGGSIYFRHNKWVARKIDHIERAMVIYENGKRKTIIVNGSKPASKIGEYYNTIKKFLQTGNEKELKRSKWIIKDNQGKLHKLETDPQKILDIEEAKEEPELTEIYSEEDL